MRLFVAVRLPATLDPIIDAAIEPWKERFPHARWVPPENRHVTLKFLGSTEERQLGFVEERIHSAVGDAASIPLALAGLGAFPSARRATVLWVGVRDGDARLTALAGTLDAALAPKFAAERRPFTAHVTVARSKDSLSLPERELSRPVAAEPFAVDEVLLMRSRPGRPAPRYEMLRSFPLEG